MRHFAIRAVLAFLIGILSATALAIDDPIANRPEFQVDDTFIYLNNGRTQHQRLESRDGGQLTFDIDGMTAVFTLDLNRVGAWKNDKQVVRWKPHNHMLVFPLSVGSVWDETYTTHSQKDGAYERSKACEVLAYGPKKVRAGSFNSFHIRCDNQRIGRDRPARENYWYAPDVGRPGTGRIIHYNAPALGLEWELAEVRLAPTTVSAR